MLIKVIIVIFLLLILYSLGSALYYLVSKRNNSIRVVEALTWRIALSLTLFILLFLAYWLGWITPHQI
ncbi:MAG TPA: twin transmembrane helix small protein [Gammaproteobacteria bacterium]|nr:twin transmembrane helix small protein [Gammaproteobacteria bacterium]